MRSRKSWSRTFEKIEGLAVLGDHLWAALDNDGGEFENRLVDLGGIALLLGQSSKGK